MSRKWLCFKCKWTGEESQVIRDPQFSSLQECPKCRGFVNEIQYNEKVDPIIYGNGTDGFTREDWIRLAYAALSQGDVTQKLIDYLVNELEVEDFPHK